MVEVTQILISSLALSVSLAWNEFFKNTIKKIYPLGSNDKTIIANFMYALFVTVVVLLVYQFYIQVKQKIEEQQKIKTQEEEEKVRKVIIVGVDKSLLAKLKKQPNNTPKKK